MADKSLRPRVAFVLRGMPMYRLPVYRRLHERGIVNFRVFCQRFDLPAERVGFLEPSSTDGIPVTWSKAAKWTVSFKRRFGLSTPSLHILPGLMRYRPSVIVFESLSNLGSDLLCTPFVRWHRIPFVWWSLGAIPGRSDSLKSRCGDLIQSWYVRQAAAVLTYSSHGKTVLEQLGANPDRTFIAYNTLDEKEQLERVEHCRPLVPALKDQLGLSNQPVAVFSGTINHKKRVDMLIKAFFEVRKIIRSKDPRLIIIGDGEDLLRCQQQAEDLGLCKVIHFVGRQEKFISAYFLLAQVAVLPGLGGLSINHAFVHRLPVICGKADGCEVDLVHGRETGIRLDEMTVPSLSQALCSLLENAALAQKMGEKAFELITTKITLDNLAATIERGIICSLESG